MALKVGFLSSAHLHAGGFLSALRHTGQAEIVGIWDDQPARGQEFAQQNELKFFADASQLVEQADGLVICSENLHHLRDIKLAVEAKKHFICEKPIAASKEHLKEISSLVEDYGKVAMTAFPCPYSSNFKLAMERISSGNIGKVLAISSTNQGQCPFGWFVDPALSGGSAMIDHTVHVADLLWRITKSHPVSVYAQTGNNTYGQDFDDTAIVTVEFENGVIATIDGSWSKLPSYKTWGNVRLTILGEKGVVECDLFAQGLEILQESQIKHISTGSNLDRLLMQEFVDAIEENRAPLTSIHDGLWASRIAIAGYASVDEGKAQTA